MILRQFLHTDPVIAASYLVGCGGQGVCIIVDPVDTPDFYVRNAESLGVRITNVIDTHVHADHHSTGPALAEASGAVYVLHDSVESGHDVAGVGDGARIEVGNVACEVMHGDMGRTELASSAEDGARALFASALRLKGLPDHVVVLPGAFAGSVCGRALSANPVSTIGFERRFNKSFVLDDETQFVAAMVKDIPPAPPRAAEIRAANLGPLAPTP